MDKIKASRVATRVRIQVDASTTKEQAVALRELLTTQYEQYMEDLADDDLYSGMTRLLEKCGFGGDFNVDRPDFDIWIGDKHIA